MDANRFDALARALAGITVRRRLLAGAAPFLLGGLPAVLGPVAADARKERTCLFGQRRCRDDRCHGCCSDADCGGNVCEQGTCSDCPRTARLCRGGCIPEESCCSDSECTGGRVCVDGSCACRADERECDGSCIARGACCGTDCPVETCSAETCNGCCDGDTCRNGDSPNFCGRGGEACAQCEEGRACNGVRCVCAAGECCRDSDCTAASGGLCRPDHTCAYPPDCAGLGQTCVANFECCSLFCAAANSECQQSEQGQPCHVDGDCLFGTTCQFYVCRP